jgi:hypothetical protein
MGRPSSYRGVKLRLNRDYAISDDGLVGRSTDNHLAAKMKDAGKTVVWHLDIAQGLASLQKPGAHMAAHLCRGLNVEFTLADPSGSCSPLHGSHFARPIIYKRIKTRPHE